MSKRKPHTTHLTILSAVALVLAATLAVSSTHAVAAKGLEYGKKEAACYVFAVGAGRADAEIHANRVRAEVLGSAQTAYIIGYQTGVLDAYAALNATDKLISYELARKTAAAMLYEVRNCSTAEDF